MRLTHVLTIVFGLATLASGSSAWANDLGEDSTWQFRSANTTVQMQNNLSYMAARRMGTLGAYGVQGAATLGSGAGLLTSATTAANNFTQVVNETSINCAGAGAGAVCSATGGGNSTSVGQTSSGSSSTAHAEATGNTLTNNSNNQNTSNTGYGTTTFNGVPER